MNHELILSDLVDLHYDDKFGVKNKLQQLDFSDKKSLDNLLMAYDIIINQQSKKLTILKSLQSKISIFDHQILAAQRVKNDLNGHALLADEVGLGKTIEAGILLKEYYTTGLIKTALILVPPSLVGQWKSEMESKFGLNFIASKDDDDFMGYDRHNMLIASLSSVHMEKNALEINSIDWDMVIVDEAHRLKNSKTKAHQFVKELSKKFLLLLSATPMQNNLKELYNLIELVRPGHLGTWNNFAKTYLQDENSRALVMEKRHELQDLLSQVIIRTTRDEVKRYIEFTDRIPKTHILESNIYEKNLYSLTTKYIKNLWGRNRSVVLPLMTLQRQLSSSTYATIPALRRKMKDDQKENKKIQELIYLAEKIETDTKMIKLKEIIRNDEESKFLIFTEFRDTQDYIYDSLWDENFNVVKFNGSMSTSERDVATSEFQKKSQIMVATEAGGEGKNFQFCHNVVNYDLPWNPMKVEQRVGRVHRIGQEEDVVIHNFSIKDTIEEYVLKLLYEKVNLFKMTIGELDLFEDHGPHMVENKIFESYISSNSKQEIINKFSALGKEWNNEKTKIEETMNEFNPEVFSNFKLSVLGDV